MKTEKSFSPFHIHKMRVYVCTIKHSVYVGDFLQTAATANKKPATQLNTEVNGFISHDFRCAHSRRCARTRRNIGFGSPITTMWNRLHTERVLPHTFATYTSIEIIQHRHTVWFRVTMLPCTQCMFMLRETNCER